MMHTYPLANARDRPCCWPYATGTMWIYLVSFAES